MPRFEKFEGLKKDVEEVDELGRRNAARRLGIDPSVLKRRTDPRLERKPFSDRRREAEKALAMRQELFNKRKAAAENESIEKQESNPEIPQFSDEEGIRNATGRLNGAYDDLDRKE